MKKTITFFILILSCNLIFADWVYENNWLLTEEAKPILEILENELHEVQRSMKKEYEFYDDGFAGKIYLLGFKINSFHLLESLINDGNIYKNGHIKLKIIMKANQYQSDFSQFDYFAKQHLMRWLDGEFERQRFSFLRQTKLPKKKYSEPISRLQMNSLQPSTSIYLQQFIGRGTQKTSASYHIARGLIDSSPDGKNNLVNYVRNLSRHLIPQNQIIQPIFQFHFKRQNKWVEKMLVRALWNYSKNVPKENTEDFSKLVKLMGYNVVYYTFETVVKNLCNRIGMGVDITPANDSLYHQFLLVEIKTTTPRR